jgi:hypothetical protein
MSQDKEDKSLTDQPTAPAPVPMWKRLLPVLFVFAFLAMAATPSFAAGFEDEIPGFNIPVENIMAAFWNGADMVFGLTGLITLIALPYGISFAFQVLSSIFNRFTSAIRI